MELFTQYTKLLDAGGSEISQFFDSLVLCGTTQCRSTYLKSPATLEVNESYQTRLLVHTSTWTSGDHWLQENKGDQARAIAAAKIVEDHFTAISFGRCVVEDAVELGDRTFFLPRDLVMIHVWQSRKEGKRAAEAFRRAGQRIFELSLTGMHVPLSSLVLHQGMYLSVVWLPPLVTEKPCINQQGSLLDANCSLLQSSLQLKRQPPVHQGVDGRTYLVNLRDVVPNFGASKMHTVNQVPRIEQIENSLKSQIPVCIQGQPYPTLDKEFEGCLSNLYDQWKEQGRQCGTLFENGVMAVVLHEAGIKLHTIGPLLHKVGGHAKAHVLLPLFHSELILRTFATVLEAAMAITSQSIPSYAPYEMIMDERVSALSKCIGKFKSSSAFWAELVAVARIKYGIPEAHTIDRKEILLSPFFVRLSGRLGVEFEGPKSTMIRDFLEPSGHNSNIVCPPEVVTALLGHKDDQATRMELGDVQAAIENAKGAQLLMMSATVLWKSFITDACTHQTLWRTVREVAMQQITREKGFSVGQRLQLLNTLMRCVPKSGQEDAEFLGLVLMAYDGYKNQVSTPYPGPLAFNASYCVAISVHATQQLSPAQSSFGWMFLARVGQEMEESSIQTGISARGALISLATKSFALAPSAFSLPVLDAMQLCCVYSGERAAKGLLVMMLIILDGGEEDEAVLDGVALGHRSSRTGSLTSHHGGTARYKSFSSAGRQSMTTSRGDPNESSFMNQQLEESAGPGGGDAAAGAAGSPGRSPPSKGPGASPSQSPAPEGDSSGDESLKKKANRSTAKKARAAPRSRKQLGVQRLRGFSAQALLQCPDLLPLLHLMVPIFRQGFSHAKHYLPYSALLCGCLALLMRGLEIHPDAQLVAAKQWSEEDIPRAMCTETTTNGIVNTLTTFMDAGFWNEGFLMYKLLLPWLKSKEVESFRPRYEEVEETLRRANLAAKVLTKLLSNPRKFRIELLQRREHFSRTLVDLRQNREWENALEKNRRETLELAGAQVMLDFFRECRMAAEVLEATEYHIRNGIENRRCEILEKITREAKEIQEVDVRNEVQKLEFAERQFANLPQPFRLCLVAEADQRRATIQSRELDLERLGAEVQQWECRSAIAVEQHLEADKSGELFREELQQLLLVQLEYEEDISRWHLVALCPHGASSLLSAQAGELRERWSIEQTEARALMLLAEQELEEVGIIDPDFKATRRFKAGFDKLEKVGRDNVCGLEKADRVMHVARFNAQLDLLKEEQAETKERRQYVVDREGEILTAGGMHELHLMEAEARIYEIEEPRAMWLRNLHEQFERELDVLLQLEADLVGDDEDGEENFFRVSFDFEESEPSPKKAVVVVPAALTPKATVVGLSPGFEKNLSLLAKEKPNDDEEDPLQGITPPLASSSSLGDKLSSIQNHTNLLHKLAGSIKKWAVDTESAIKARERPPPNSPPAQGRIPSPPPARLLPLPERPPRCDSATLEATWLYNPEHEGSSRASSCASRSDAKLARIPKVHALPPPPARRSQAKKKLEAKKLKSPDPDPPARSPVAPQLQPLSEELTRLERLKLDVFTAQKRLQTVKGATRVPTAASPSKPPFKPARI